jgi:metal-responsive CopG/Arc/MetJ family transcriptional regulator
MMKNVANITISLPKEMVKRLDRVAKMLHISRSSVTTAMLSVVLNHDKNTIY